MRQADAQLEHAPMKGLFTGCREATTRCCSGGGVRHTSAPADLSTPRPSTRSLSSAMLGWLTRNRTPDTLRDAAGSAV